MIRAFIAVELDDALREEIAHIQQHLRASLERSAPEARISWVRPASMHLTIKFLGDIDESLVPALHDLIAEAARQWHAIEIPLTRPGGFPRLQEPRNLWLGPEERWENSEAALHLQTIAREIDEIAAAHDIAREKRAFSPHLTLARIKSRERAAGHALTAASGVQMVHLPPLHLGAVTLLKSQLDSKGAIHTPLWTVNLRTSAPPIDR